MKKTKNSRARAASPIREELRNRIPEMWGKYISYDTGWDWILEDLNRKFIFVDPDYTLNQVKEKFGTLRFYFETDKGKVAHEILWDLVAQAEYWSSKTCENCGSCNGKSNTERDIKFDKTVTLRSKPYWYKTLCESCADELGYEHLASESEY